MGKKDYYEILGVAPDATDEEIRTAYLKLALRWHPDKHKGDDGKGDDGATDKFQQIGEAYHVLQDPMQRAEYDEADEEDDYDMADGATLEEYLHRFQTFILTVNGLGLETAVLNNNTLNSGDLGGGFGGLLGMN